MSRRSIVEIDEAKCNGCGQCVPACAEGAIRIVNGKARLVADVLCDGLGACLGHCPQGAITIVERDAQPFDESAVAPTKTPAACGCPGIAMRDLRPNDATDAARHPLLTTVEDQPEAAALAHWPIQLRLVPANAPFLRGADLFLVADCVPFACAKFHERLLRSRPIVIGCPKLDDAQAYIDKLTDVIQTAGLSSLTVVHMEVPCCTGLVRIAAEAIRRSGVELPLDDVTITIKGGIRPNDSKRDLLNLLDVQSSATPLGQPGIVK